MKRVLFVDDDIYTLDSLRLRLHRESDWHSVFVDNAERALSELERQPFDVIVTDIRMPGMDGDQLLQNVRERWPETVRIALSGYAAFQQALNLAPLAHQFISKPCESEQLKNRIERCLELHTFLRKPELRTVVGRIRTLPALPRTYSRLQAVICREDACVPEVARIVAADSAIAAKVLQMVNSAFFRLARRITNVEQAVSYLGFAAVSNLVLSAEVFSQWSKPAGGSGLDLEQLQRHVQRVGAAASALTAKTPIADDTMLAALLHDIGYWVLAQECPKDFQAAMKLASERGIPFHEAQVQIFGASHAEIGAYLLGLWGLPYSVIEAVALHRAPHRVGHAQFDVLTALAVAHSLVDVGEDRAFGLPDYSEPDMSDVEALQLPFDWAEAKRRVAETLQLGESQT